MTEPNYNLSRKALSATKYTIFYRVLSQVVGAVSVVFLVRLLSEHDYGIYNLLYSIIAFLGMVFSLGIGNTLLRYNPEYYSQGEFILANKLNRYASLLRLFSNVATLGLIFILWDYVGPLLKITAYKNYFLFFSLIILLHMQRAILEICLNSYFLQKYSKGFSFVFTLMKGAGYGFAFIFNWNLWSILVIDLMAYLVVFLLLQLVYWKKIPHNGGHYDKFPREERKRLTRYACFYNFNDAGVGLLDANFDNFIIVMYLNPVSVGAYAFCNRISNMVGRLLPLNFLLDVIRPLFFVGNQEGHSDQIRLNFQLLIKTTYIFYLPIFIFFLLFSKELIMIFFKGKFIEYYPMLIAVVFFNLVNAIQLPVGLVAQLRERADIIFYSKLFAIYNLLADIVFIRYLGIWGAVIATGTAVLGKNIYIWYFVRKEADLNGMGLFFSRMIEGWLIIAGACYVFRFFITSDFLRLAIGTVVIILGLIVQFRFIPFNQAERQILHYMSEANKRVRLLLKLSGFSAAMAEE